MAEKSQFKDVYGSSSASSGLASQFEKERKIRQKLKEDEEDKKNNLANSGRNTDGTKKNEGLDLGSVVEGLFGFAKDLPKNIATGIQQNAGAVADTALMGGDVVGEISDTIQGKSTEEKNKRYKTTERLRDELKKQKTAFTNEDLVRRQEDFQWTGDIARDIADLSARGLDVGLGATQFANPTSIAMKTAGRETGKQALKQGAKDAAAFAGLDTVAGGSEEYARSGDLGEAAKAGLTQGAISGISQGAMSGAGYAIGRGTDKAVSKFEKGKKPTEAQKQLGAGSTTKGIESGITTRDENGNIIAQAGEGAQAQRQLEATNPRYAELEALKQERDARKNGELIESDWADAEGLAVDNAMRLQQDEQYLKGREELTKKLVDAEDSLKQYNDYLVSSPYHRQVDKLDNQAMQLDQQRQAEIEQARAITSDEQVTDPTQAEANFGILEQEINARYEPEYQAIQQKHNELAQKYPQDALEAPVLRQSMAEAGNARMEAEMALERHESDSMSRMAAQAAGERNDARMQELDDEIAIREQEIQDIKDRKVAPVETTEQATQKVNDIAAGNYTRETHPELFNEDGSLNKDAVKKAHQGAVDEVRQVARKEVLDKDPETVPNEELFSNTVDDVLENIRDKKLTIGNAWAKSLLSVDEFLNTIGAGKLADNLEFAITKAHRSKADDKAIFRSWLDKAKNDSTDMLWKAADGNETAYASLSDGGKQVIDAWRTYAKGAADELGLPDDNRISDYIPHIFDKDSINDDGFIPEGLARILKKNDEGNVNNGFLKKRTGATKGLEQDFWKAIEAYSEQKARKVHIEPATKQLMEVADNVNDKQLKKYLTQTADHLRGIKNNPLDEKLNELTGGAATPALRGFKNLVSPAAIWFNPSSAMNSLAQISNVTTELGPVGVTKAMFQANNLLKHVVSEKTGADNIPMVKGLSKEETKMWRDMHRDGIFEGDIASLVGGDLKSRAAQRANDAGYAMINGADRYMRIVSYIGAYDKAAKKGLTGEAQAQYARRVVNKANFNFDSMRVPPLFRSQTARSMGTLVTFMPGMLKYTADIAGGAAGATKNIATGKYTKADKEALTKALYFTASAVGVSSLINGATSNGEDWTPDVTKIVPNPLDENTLVTPAISFLTGTDTKVGLKDAITTGGEDDVQELKDFATKTLPSTFIPGFGQGNKMLQANDAIQKGYAEGSTGNIQFSTEGWDDNDKLAALAFGKYNSKEGREYVNNIGQKDENGRQIPAGLSKYDTQRVLESDPENRNQAIDFYQQAKKISGHSDASKEITSLLDAKRPRAAMRKANEFNSKVDEILEPYYAKYPDMADELREDLNKRIYINTKRIKRELEED